MGGVISGIGDFLFGSEEPAQQTGTAPTMTPGQRQLLDQLSGMLGQRFEGIDRKWGTGHPADVGMPSTGVKTSSLLDNFLNRGTGAFNPSSILASGKMQNEGSSGLGIPQITGGGFQPGVKLADPGGSGISPPQGFPAPAGADPLSQANPTGMEAINQIMAGNDPGATTEWWENSVKNPMMEAWQQDILPKVMEPFVQANSFDSGANRRAVAESGRRLNTDMGAMLSDAQQNQRSQHLDRLQNVPGMAMGLEQQPFDNLLKQLGIGMGATDWQRNIQNTERQSKSPYNDPLMQLLPMIMGANAFSPIVQGPTQQQGFLNSFVAPVATGFFGGGGSLFGEGGIFG